MAGKGKVGRLPNGKKYGGRKPGTPNKITIDFVRDVEATGLELVIECKRIYDLALGHFHRDRSEFKFKYLEIAQRQVLDMLRYVYPQRKAIDHTTLGQPISFADLIKAAEETK